MKGIEPTSCLINAFGNKIRRKILFDNFFIFKVKMPLSIVHRSAVEPDIHQVRNAFHWPALFAHKNDLINIGLMKIKYVIMQIIFINSQGFTGFFYSLL